MKTVSCCTLVYFLTPAIHSTARPITLVLDTTLSHTLRYIHTTLPASITEWRTSMLAYTPDSESETELKLQTLMTSAMSECLPVVKMSGTWKCCFVL